MSFTLPEKRLIDKNYFIIIRTDITFYEIKSRNTGHCWIIKKIVSNTSKPIQVYHKHSNNTLYYHKHKLTTSVKNAISTIVNHDIFVLKQAAYISF